MMLHRWKVRYAAKISAASVNTENTMTPGAMKRYADRCRQARQKNLRTRVFRTSRRTLPGAGGAAVDICGSSLSWSRVRVGASHPRPGPVRSPLTGRRSHDARRLLLGSAAGQDRLGLLGGVVEGL